MRNDTVTSKTGMPPLSADAPRDWSEKCGSCGGHSAKRIPENDKESRKMKIKWAKRYCTNENQIHGLTGDNGNSFALEGRLSPEVASAVNT
jgi:hypothetical protein